MLQDQFSESIQAEAPKQEAKSGDHGHDSEISRRKQPCQDDYRPDLHYKHSQGTSNGHPGTANCGPAKSPARGDRTERAVGLERFQFQSDSPRSSLSCNGFSSEVLLVSASRAQFIGELSLPV